MESNNDNTINTNEISNNQSNTNQNIDTTQSPDVSLSNLNADNLNLESNIFPDIDSPSNFRIIKKTSSNINKHVVNFSNLSDSNSKYDNDKSFNRLKEIQKLLKKESALKELFIKTRDDTKTKIEEQCKDYYQKKLEYLSYLQKLQNKERKRINVVSKEKQNEILKDLSNYIPNFLFYLWDDPKFLSQIIKNSNIKDTETILAPFIANNFYENILSFNCLEENFIYCLCILLSEEINSLSTNKDISKFLNESPCSYLLTELINKSDIKSYFKIIIQNTIEIIEKTCYNRKINFDIEEIENELKEYTDTKDISINKPGKKKKLSLRIDEGLIFRKKIKNDLDFIKTTSTISGTSTNTGFTNLNVSPSNRDSHLKQLSGISNREGSFFTEKNSPAREKNDVFDMETYEIFSKKYMPELSNNDLNTKLKNSDDILLKDYLQYNLCNISQNSENIYSNDKFLEKVAKSKKSNEVLYLYQNDFMKVINVIKDLFENLLDNLHLIPYSIKCLCKIILTLVKKKFPGLSTTEENSFIAKFFFSTLFSPIFKEPASNALINDFIISGKTNHNLSVITSIILQLVSGKLYTNEKFCENTPFNWFFIDEVPSLCKFFEHVSKVELPSFIEKYLENELDKNFKYDYFQENPDEVISHRSICCNINEINCLLETVDKCKDKLFTECPNFKLQKTFEKLYSKKNKNFIKSLIENKEYENKRDPKNNENNNTKNNITHKNNLEIVNYYLVTELIYNKKYENIFKLAQKTKQYNINELKETKTNEEIETNNIIKVKNYLNTLLYNYRTLVKTDFDEGTTSDVISILNELKIFMKSSNFVIDGSIPSEWYINSLIKYFEKIPENLTANDFEKLFDEIENDLKESIYDLDFEILSVFINQMKFTDRDIGYYDNMKQIVIDILLNNKVRKIIEEENIRVELSLRYSKDKKEFLIKKTNNGKKNSFLGTIFSFEGNEKKPQECKNIRSFTRYFPNFYKMTKKYNEDVFEIQSKLEIPKKLNEYFEYIKDNLTKYKKYKDPKIFEKINEKIYDYVLSKLYDKIFPKDQTNEDKRIYEKTLTLSWVEPKHFIVGKTNFVYDNFLPDVYKYFYLLDKEKSPRKKLKTMSNIFRCIFDLIRFNNTDGTDVGVDDSLPILNYAFVMAQPTRIFSNCRFMELYIGDLKSKNEGSQLIQLQSICKRMENFNYELLNDVSKEEYDEKCNQSWTNSIFELIE